MKDEPPPGLSNSQRSAVGKCSVFLDQPVILGISHNWPVVELMEEVVHPYDLDICVNGVSRLMHYIPLAPLQVILQPRGLVDADGTGVTQKIRPVVF